MLGALQWAMLAGRLRRPFNALNVLPETGRLCGLGGTAGGEQAAQRSRAEPADQIHDLAKVTVAGSNLVVRSE